MCHNKKITVMYALSAIFGVPFAQLVPETKELQADKGRVLQDAASSHVTLAPDGVSVDLG